MVGKMVALTLCLVCICALQTVTAQVSAGPEVSEMVICTAVEDRTPVGADSMFLNTVGQLYCFTKVSGVTESTTISHVWYFNEQEMAKVDLNVAGEGWRTWSSKQIVEDWGGKWRVEVVSAAGDVLMTKPFTVQSATP